MPIREFPASPDITAANPTDVIYIKGDEFTDGSIRFLYSDPDEFAHIESRNNGVWNDTGLRFSPNSIEVGRDMFLSSAAGFLGTFNPSAAHGHGRSLIPHIQFDNDGGTEKAHLPFLDKPRDFVIYENPVGEIVGTTIGQVFNVAPSRIMKTSTHQVGSVGASAQVTHSFYTGTDNTGLLFSRFNIPAGDLVATSPLVIDYKSAFGFDSAANIFMELTSASNFSLQTDVGGNLVTTHFAYEIKEIDSLADELVLSNDLGICFSNAGQFVIRDQF